jgi:hypothetical protein
MEGGERKRGIGREEGRIEIEIGKKRGNRTEGRGF